MLNHGPEDLNAEQLRQAVQALSAQLAEHKALVARHERELAFKQATIDKLAHEMAVLKRLKFAATAATETKMKA